MALRNYKEVKVCELVNFSANSRTHSEEQVNQIVQSIKEFGFTSPLLIDEKNIIIAGHGRLQAAIFLKMETVPCIILEGLSDAKKRALVIADNKIALNSSWNIDILRKEISDLKTFNYDLSTTGFDIAEIEDIFTDVMPEVFLKDYDDKFQKTSQNDSAFLRKKKELTKEEDKASQNFKYPYKDYFIDFGDLFAELLPGNA